MDTSQRAAKVIRTVYDVFKPGFGVRLRSSATTRVATKRVRGPSGLPPTRADLYR